MLNNMNKLNSSQRRQLKSQAHHYKPIINIGKEGIGKGVIESINIALTSKELIKVKFNDFKEEKILISNKISEVLSCNVIGIIGHTVILFRKNPNIEDTNFLDIV